MGLLTRKKCSLFSSTGVEPCHVCGKLHNFFSNIPSGENSKLAFLEEKAGWSRKSWRPKKKFFFLQNRKHKTFLIDSFANEYI
jgi:hypothetical protein